MSKRARQSSTGIKFSYELLAVGKDNHRGLKCKPHSVMAEFSVPLADEECPLTLDLISESKLSILPDTPFLLDRPQHSKLTLPCGHSFSAMTLIYSFCKNYMVCPCCRAGKEERMDIACLPRHLRHGMETHIQQITRQEAQEDENDIMQDLIARSMSEIPYEVLAVNNNLSLQMEFYHVAPEFYRVTTVPSLQTVQPVFSMNVGMQAVMGQLGQLGQPGQLGQLGQLPTLQPRTDLRSIANIAHMGVNAVRLSVHLCMRGIGSVPIDATPITPLPFGDSGNPGNNSGNNSGTNSGNNSGTNFENNRLTIPGITSVATTHQNGVEVVIVQLHADNNNTPSTKFTVFFSHPSVIQNIVWHPEAETLAILSNNGVAAML